VSAVVKTEGKFEINATIWREVRVRFMSKRTSAFRQRIIGAVKCDDSTPTRRAGVGVRQPRSAVCTV